MKTEKEIRQEYNQMRNDDPAFAECWSTDDHDFYEWCSGYGDYKHITFAECWSTDDHDFYEWCSGYGDYKHITRKGK